MSVTCFIVKVKSKYNNHVFLISDCFESREKAEQWGEAVQGGCSYLYFEVNER